MSKITDIRPSAARLYFLPVTTRIPLKFGPETLTSVTCARVALQVEDHQGRRATGWGETPLSVQWVWPGKLSYSARQEALQAFTLRLGAAWADFAHFGHPLEVGIAFQQQVLPGLLEDFNRRARPGSRANALAGGAGVLLGFRYRSARRLRRAARSPNLCALWPAAPEPGSERLPATGAQLPGGFRRALPAGLFDLPPS